MLESQSCLISRALPSSCEQESKWVYMTYHLIEVSNGKRRFEDEGEEEELLAERKTLKREATHFYEKENYAQITPNSLSLTLAIGSDQQAHGGFGQTGSKNEKKVQLGKRKHSQQIDLNQIEEMTDVIHDAEQIEVICKFQLCKDEEQEVHGKQVIKHGKEDQAGTNRKPPSEEKLKSLLLWDGESSNGIELNQREQMTHNLNDLALSPANQSDQVQRHTEQMDMVDDLIFVPRDQDNQQGQDENQMNMAHDFIFLAVDQDNPQDQDGNGDQGHMDSLIQPLGRDISINCLLRCSRSEYNSLAKLNRSFRNLIRNGELYRLRRQTGIIEHWVYFSCHAIQWQAFDPISRRWMSLPPMRPNECFMLSDKESTAVGTELLVFGKEITSHVIWRYSILTNSWSSGMEMNAPRCLFGSASLGDIAILAGGCDSRGRVSDVAELYNAETGTWEILPRMNKPRKMCSGVFMDGKFYVVGGRNSDLLTCGEEYNLETRTWREIPNMFPRQNGPAEAPPLVAVVNNELYAADYAENELMKYDKERVSWSTVGRLPERVASMNGWGLAFRACGEHLIVISGPRSGGGIIELNAWIPNNGPPQWNLLASRHSGSFVYNCAVMGC